MAASTSSTRVLRPSFAASVKYWWSCRPRRKFASCTVADRAGNAAILVRVQAILARINQHAVPIDETLIVGRPLRLLAVVERDALRPHVLVPFPLLLRVVPPVDGVPIEVHADVVLEGRPDRGARVGCRRIDGDGSSCRATAVVEPVLTPAGPLAGHAIQEEAFRAGIPDIDRGVEGFNVPTGDKNRQSPTRPGIRVNVVGQRHDARILIGIRFVRHVEERDRRRQFFTQKRHP